MATQLQPAGDTFSNWAFGSRASDGKFVIYHSVDNKIYQSVDKGAFTQITASVSALAYTQSYDSDYVRLFFVPAGDLLFCTIVPFSGSANGSAIIAINATTGAVIASATVEAATTSNPGADMCKGCGVVDRGADVDCFLMGSYTSMGSTYTVPKRIRFTKATNTFSAIISYNITTGSPVRAGYKGLVYSENFNIVSLMYTGAGKWDIDIAAGSASHNAVNVAPSPAAIVRKGGGGSDQASYWVSSGGSVLAAKLDSYPPPATVAITSALTFGVSGSPAFHYWGACANTAKSIMWIFCIFYDNGSTNKWYRRIWSIDITLPYSQSRSYTLVSHAEYTPAPVIYAANVTNMSILLLPRDSVYESTIIPIYPGTTAKYYYDLLDLGVASGPNLTIALNSSLTSALAISLYVFNLPRQKIAALTISHKFNAALIAPGGINYLLTLDNGVTQATIPLISLTLRRSKNSLLGTITEELVAAIPTSFLSAAIAYAGFSAKLYRSINGLTQLLSTASIDLISAANDSISIKSTATIPSGNEIIELANSMYIRIINSNRSIRLAPNFAARPGNIAIINGSSQVVNAVVIYISHDQQFMEIS